MSPSRIHFYQEHLADLHEALVQHPIVLKHLSGRNVRLDGVALLPEDTFSTPFGNISALAFARMFSVFDGSRVHQQAEHKLGLDNAPPGLGYSARYIGYRFWPKLGFDAPLHTGETAGQTRLTGCTTVQEVLAVDEDWWNRAGSQRPMVFDLAPHSASWQKLVPYISTQIAPGRLI